MMTPQAFIQAIAPAAMEARRKYGISAALTIAQACLESGYGRHAPGNNLFGIKADPSWRGPVVAVPTREYEGGRWVTVEARFRAYPTLGDSLADHTRFLLQNSRYRNIIGADYRTACRVIQQDGYATDPHYADKLLAIIEQYGLARYDEGECGRGEDEVQIHELPTLQQGARGNAVKAVQAIVGATVDGVYGPQTAAKVKAWQTAHGLTADGIVGPQTWAKMFQN